MHLMKKKSKTHMRETDRICVKAPLRRNSYRSNREFLLSLGISARKRHLKNNRKLHS